MKIGVLTSSRADFGIYTPLLIEMVKESYIHLEMIAFGTHLSERHGMTINEIENVGFESIHMVETEVDDTDSRATARSYASCVSAFTKFWLNHEFDLVLCLGDRFEMNAAIQAGIPFHVKFAHFHGGEKTLGATDNIYRHQITLASTYHFTSTEEYKNRVIELIDTNKDRVFNVGSLSLSNIENSPIIERTELFEQFKLPNKPFILTTFHPETVNTSMNEEYCKEMTKVFDAVPESHHIVITMPNADANGALFRKAIIDYKKSNPERISLVESFGKKYFFSALKHAEFVLGNSSSGIIEAASFNQYVINVGNRQLGRMQSKNTFNCQFNHTDISILVNKLIGLDHSYQGENIYVKENTVELVLTVLRKIANGGL
jgi:GDP/UDP-N,N'-diacetylbacillosamine 2-epimerase (hydrolysing)